MGLYLDKTLPRDYGRKESWYFCCQPTFWGCCRARGRRVDEEELDRRTTLAKTDRDILIDNFEARNLKPEYYEPVANDVAKLEIDDKFLQVSGLKKTYENGF
jgi:hypothetical protein